MDSTPGISLSVAMTLLGHKTDIMFRRYIQRHDERPVQAAYALAAKGAANLPASGRKNNGTNSVAVGVSIAMAQCQKVE